MIARSAAVSLISSIGLVIACGGSDDEGLFAKKGDGGSGGGYSGEGGDGGSTNTGGASGAGGGSTTGGAAGATTGGATGTGGVAGSGGGELGGAGGSLGGAGGNTGGTGGTVAKESIACGSEVCSLPGNYCCQDFDFISYSWKGSCAANGTGCAGSDITCDGPEDCNSFDECCGEIDIFSGQEYYSSFTCVPKGSCDYAGDQRVICGSNPASCPAGTTCQGSTLLPGYKACAP